LTLDIWVTTAAKHNNSAALAAANSLNPYFTPPSYRAGLNLPTPVRRSNDAALALIETGLSTALIHVRKVTAFSTGASADWMTAKKTCSAGASVSALQPAMFACPELAEVSVRKRPEPDLQSHSQKRSARMEGDEHKRYRNLFSVEGWAARPRGLDPRARVRSL